MEEQKNEPPLTSAELLSLQRYLAYIPEVDNPSVKTEDPAEDSDYDDKTETKLFCSNETFYNLLQQKGQTPNLITSLVNPYSKDQDYLPSSSHLPVLDFDFPCALVPSSRPNHHHLYIDKPISWESYKKLLTVLAEVGLLEQGYVDASIAKGFTAVRIPGATKPGIPQTAFKLLQENAILKMRNRILEKKLKTTEEPVSQYSPPASGSYYSSTRYYYPNTSVPSYTTTYPLKSSTAQTITSFQNKWDTYIKLINSQSSNTVSPETNYLSSSYYVPKPKIKTGKGIKYKKDSSFKNNYKY